MQIYIKELGFANYWGILFEKIGGIGGIGEIGGIGG